MPRYPVTTQLGALYYTQLRLAPLCIEEIEEKYKILSNSADY